MFNDVVDLRDFYRSGIGQTAQRTLRRRIREMWPSVGGQVVVGMGYAIPFLGPFLDEAARVIALMPARQGVIHWPLDGPNRVALCHESQVPLPDLSVDRLLMVHALECSEQMRLMLREAWRVLSSSGRLLVVAPNRRGLWARLERTPFGHGHPFSNGQLSRLLRDNQFTPIESQPALFFPPIRRQFMHGAAPAWETAGERWFPAFSGVVMVEAGKQIYAAGTRSSAARKPIIVPLPEPARGVAERTSGPMEPERG